MHIPRAFADLIKRDPPYNLFNNCHGRFFEAKEQDEYARVLRHDVPGSRASESLKQNKHSLCMLRRGYIHAYCPGPEKQAECAVLNRITWDRDKKLPDFEHESED